MTATLTRLRPLLIGLVVLLLTAGIAFAAKPSGPANGSTPGDDASGNVQVQSENEDQDQDTDQDESAETDDAATPDEAGDNCATDPTGLTPEDLAAVSHGSVVCWAAHQETPEGYSNHGAWVSEWAKKNHGHDFGAVPEEGTVESTAATHHGNGKAKGPKDR